MTDTKRKRRSKSHGPRIDAKAPANSEGPPSPGSSSSTSDNPKQTETSTKDPANREGSEDSDEAAEPDEVPFQGYPEDGEEMTEETRNERHSRRQASVELDRAPPESSSSDNSSSSSSDSSDSERQIQAHLRGQLPRSKCCNFLADREKGTTPPRQEDHLEEVLEVPAE